MPSRTVVGLLVMALGWQPLAPSAPPNASTMPAASAPAATAPAAAPDPHLWTRRNLDLMHAAAAREGWPRVDEDREPRLASVLFLSLWVNPLMSREPGRSECLAVAQRLAQEGQNLWSADSVENAIWFLSLPEDERELGQLLQQASPPREERDRPVREGGFSDAVQPHQIVEAICKAPRAEPYTTWARGWVDRLDAAARRRGDWRGLATAYLALIRDTPEEENGETREAYIDRLLALLRAHPELRAEKDGKEADVLPLVIQELFQALGRSEELPSMKISLRARIERLLDRAGTLIYQGQADEARRLLSQDLHPLAPEAADRLTALLEGDVKAWARSTTRGPAPARAWLEEKVRQAGGWIPYFLAERGDVDAAARLLSAFKGLPPRSGAPELTYGEWGVLASFAHKKGHDDAAAWALERGFEVFERMGGGPDGTTESLSFARQALDFRDFALVEGILNRSGPPTPWQRFRLACRYRERGNAVQADRLLDDALRLAPEQTGGSTMAVIAVDLHARGEIARAERVFLDALHHVHGEDFGFGGTADIVRAAYRMNRPDLLERLYEQSKPGERLLISITAARMGLSPKEMEEPPP